MLALAPLAFAVVETAAPAHAQVTHVVVASGTEFDPSTLTIEAGDTVEWQNTNGCHNVAETTPASPAGFGSGEITCSPWMYSFTFNTPGEYSYRCDSHFTVGMTGAITVLPSTAAEELPTGVAEFDLSPNPFSDRLTLELEINRESDVRVTVSDVAGREIAVLHAGRLVAGRRFETAWAPTPSTPAGAYVVRIVGETFTHSRRVILVR